MASSFRAIDATSSFRAIDATIRPRLLDCVEAPRYRRGRFDRVCSTASRSHAIDATRAQARRRHEGSEGRVVQLRAHGADLL
jgi:hypothetical protein